MIKVKQKREAKHKPTSFVFVLKFREPLVDAVGVDHQHVAGLLVVPACVCLRVISKNTGTEGKKHKDSNKHTQFLARTTP